MRAFAISALGFALIMAVTLTIRFWGALPDVPALELLRRLAVVSGMLLGCGALCAIVVIVIPRIRWPGRN